MIEAHYLYAIKKRRTARVSSPKKYCFYLFTLKFNEIFPPSRPAIENSCLTYRLASVVRVAFMTKFAMVSLLSSSVNSIFYLWYKKTTLLLFVGDTETVLSFRLTSQL